MNIFQAILNWTKKLKTALGKGRKKRKEQKKNSYKELPVASEKLTAVQTGSEPAPTA